MVLAALVVVNQGKVEMGVLSTAVKTIVDTLEAAHGPLQDATGHLTRSLALIEIALALIAVLLGAEAMHLLRKVLTVATWLWIIDIFHDAAKALMKWLVHAAGAAFGGESAVLLQPSKILDLSTKATEPMMKKLLSMHVAIDIGTAILLGLVVLAVMLAYIALALSIALALIEFYLYLALSGLLMPFTVFGHTRFLGDKAINAVLACAIKLAVVTFITSATAPILEQVEIRARRVEHAHVAQHLGHPRRCRAGHCARSLGAAVGCRISACVAVALRHRSRGAGRVGGRCDGGRCGADGHGCFSGYPGRVLSPTAGSDPFDRVSGRRRIGTLRSCAEPANLRFLRGPTASASAAKPAVARRR